MQLNKRKRENHGFRANPIGNSPVISSLLTELAATTVIIAVAGWILRTTLSHLIEKLHRQQTHSLALDLEGARGKISRDLARLNVHESYLHKRRVELIEELYGYMIDAEFSLQTFLVSWWAESSRDELIQRGALPKDHFSRVEDSSERDHGDKFCEKYLCMNALLHRNELFFEESFTESLRQAYKPYFDMVLDYKKGNAMEFPNEFNDIVTVGASPRRAVINSFRRLLGVAHCEHEAGD